MVANVVFSQEFCLQSQRQLRPTQIQNYPGRGYHSSLFDHINALYARGGRRGPDDKHRL